MDHEKKGEDKKTDEDKKMKMMHDNGIDRHYQKYCGKIKFHNNEDSHFHSKDS